MKKLLAVAVIVGVSGGIIGCAQHAFVGHQNAWGGRWFGDVGIKGNGNNVDVQRGSNLRKLSVFGNNNCVTVEDSVTLVHVEFVGKNNTVTIPAGLLVRLTDWGTGNQLIRRPEVWDRMSEIPYGAGPAVSPTPVPPGTFIVPEPRPTIEVVPDRGSQAPLP